MVSLSEGASVGAVNDSSVRWALSLLTSAATATVALPTPTTLSSISWTADLTRVS